MRIRPVFLGLGLAVAMSGGVGRLAAAPAQIIFLRHAEKPATGSELNERGRQRAQALVGLFANDPRTREHGVPVAIYAGAPAKAGGSVRSIETIQPTGLALKIAVDTHITRDEIDALVRAIMEAPAYEGKTVIVCWEHKKIPEMLKAFGWSAGPGRWDDAVFDRLWLLDFAQGKPVRFRDLPQTILPGDSKI
jgi:hypothetical protein